ncbi:unnamed protein product [Absidia cylindrospora]
MQLNIAEFPVQMLVHIVSDLLESIIQTNDELMIDTPLTHFHSRAKPNISILAYLTRILKFAPFSNEALLSLLVYFDRIALKQQYAVNSFNVHRLLITSVVVASKFTSDVYYPNSRYAKVGGLPLLELNQLELEFLFLCEFQLHVSLEDLQDYGNQLLSHAMNIKTTPLALSAASSLASPPMDEQPTPHTPVPTEYTTVSIVTTEEANNKTRTISRMIAPMKTGNRPTVETALDSRKLITNDTTAPSTASSTKRKRKCVLQQISLAQKRFCPSPPYSATDSGNTKIKSSLDALLH